MPTRGVAGCLTVTVGNGKPSAVDAALEGEGGGPRIIFFFIAFFDWDQRSEEVTLTILRGEILIYITRKIKGLER